MSKTMTPKSCKNVTVIQMLGSMPSQPDLTIIESSSQIAYKLSGRIASLRARRGIKRQTGHGVTGRAYYSIEF